MTKADIVNEITKNTGIDKVTVLTTLEAFMDTVKDSLSKEEKCVPAWFWKFCSEEKSSEDCSQHFKEHYNHYSGAQYSGI